jgi:hypothetical protein
VEASHLAEHLLLGCKLVKPALHTALSEPLFHWLQHYTRNCAFHWLHVKHSQAIVCLFLFLDSGWTFTVSPARDGWTIVIVQASNGTRFIRDQIQVGPWNRPIGQTARQLGIAICTSFCSGRAYLICSSMMSHWLTGLQNSWCVLGLWNILLPEPDITSIFSSLIQGAGIQDEIILGT